MTLLRRFALVAACTLVSVFAAALEVRFVPAPSRGWFTDLAAAKADAHACPPALRAHVKQALGDEFNAGAAVHAFDAKPIAQLNAAEPMPGIGSCTDLELQ